MAEPSAEGTPIGYLLSLEGADSMVTPLMPSAPTPGLAGDRPGPLRPWPYAQGTNATGGLSAQGPNCSPRWNACT